MASRRAPLVVVGAAALGSLAVAVWALVKLRRVKKETDKLADMRLQERQGRIRAEKVGIGANLVVATSSWSAVAWTYAPTDGALVGLVTGQGDLFAEGARGGRQRQGCPSCLGVLAHPPAVVVP
jgi:hypothetical protein